MAIFAKCKICKDHIISYIDEWKEVPQKGGGTIRMKVDVWLHDIYDYDPEPTHEAVPDKGEQVQHYTSYPNIGFGNM